MGIQSEDKQWWFDRMLQGSTCSLRVQPIIWLWQWRDLQPGCTKRIFEESHCHVNSMRINTSSCWCCNGRALNEEVYMEQEEWTTASSLQVTQSIYGLKRSSRCWNAALNTHLKHLGFIQSKSDPCITTEKVIPLSILECMLMTLFWQESMSRSSAMWSINLLSNLGELSYFLGISIIENQEKKTTWIGQPTYTETLLAKMGMSDCNPVKTPVDPSNYLKKESDEESALDQQL